MRRAIARRSGTASHTLQWAIKIGAPPGPDGDVWGDVFFAADLAVALRDRGHRVYVDRYGAVPRADNSKDDVVVSLRGLMPMPPDGDAVRMLWVISHPDLVTESDIRGFDVALAASVPWAQRMSHQARRKVWPVLQAADPARFAPGPVSAARASDVLFVGKSRDVFRPIVRDALEVGADLSIYGDGWEQFIGMDRVRAEFLENEKVPDAYRSARIVLNDHWDDMKREGFLSNRLFDAAATGACIVTDDVQGVSEVFGSAVQTYASTDDLARLLASDANWPDREERLRQARAVAERHSFAHRAEELEQIVNRYLGR